MLASETSGVVSKTLTGEHENRSTMFIPEKVSFRVFCAVGHDKITVRSCVVLSIHHQPFIHFFFTRKKAQVCGDKRHKSSHCLV